MWSPTPTRSSRTAAIATCSADVLDDIDRIVALGDRAPGLLRPSKRSAAGERSGPVDRQGKDPEKRAALIDEGKRSKPPSPSGRAAPSARGRDNQRLRRDSQPDPSRRADRPTEDDSLELRRWALPAKFDFKPLDHVELGKELDLIDFEGGGKVGGHGFYFLKNDAVLLELAFSSTRSEVSSAGFTPMTTPDLARNEMLQGIGFIPAGRRRRSMRSKTPI